MYPAIKLYPKSMISSKANTLSEAKQEVEKLRKLLINDRVYGQRQEFGYQIKETKRKRFPIDWEVSFYEIETIKEMDRDKNV